MPDILDNYIKKVHTFQISNKISNYYHKIIIRKNRFLKLIVIRFEIFKIKLELKKNYINLGKFIFKNYDKEKVIDFSYKNDFFSLNQEIKKNLRYIKKIESSNNK